MIITTIDAKPCSVIFIFFTFASFLLMKLLGLSNFIANKSEINVYIMLVILSLLVSFMYILLDINFKRWFKRKEVNQFTHIEKYDCKQIVSYGTLCVLKVKENMLATYSNLELYHSDPKGYMRELHSRYESLSKKDTFLIYFYEYINVVMMSVLLFVMYKVFLGININVEVFKQVIGIIIILAVSAFLYMIIVKLCLLISTKSMEKRNLNFFVCR